ncbi:hypothetical protein ACWCOW_38490 [Streptomyces sp. NPDC001939]
MGSEGTFRRHPGPPHAAAGPRPSIPEREPPEPTATQNCPHCDQPVTIVALLATPEAARLTITNRVTEVAPLRRLQ